MARVGKMKMRVPGGMKYFDKREVNTGEQWEYNVFVEPRTLDFSPDRELEFFVSGNTTDQLNLAKSTFNIKFKVRKRNPEHNFATAAEATGDAAEYAIPIDGFFHTMWKTIVLKLNNEIVSNSKEHPYRAYLDLLTSIDASQLHETGDNWMYTSNTGTPDETANPYASGNACAVKRWDMVKDKESVTLSGPLLIDFWNQPTLILGGVDFQLFMTPAFDKFRFQTTHKATLKDELYLDIEHCYLELWYKTITPPALKGISAALQHTPASYPYTRTEVTVLQLRRGVQETRLVDLFSRQIPARLLMVMVKQDAYVGDLSLDPFNFVNNKITSASFHIDNVSIPSRAYNFDLQRDPRGSVQQALDELRRFAGHKDIGITKSNFANGGKFVLVFNTDPTVSKNLDYWGVKRSGNTKLHLTFQEPIDSEYQIILVATFPATVQIDKNAVVSILN